MRTCERLVKEGRFTPSNPVGILTSGYYELLQNKVPLLGEFLPHGELTVEQRSVLTDTPITQLNHVHHSHPLRKNQNQKT